MEIRLLQTFLQVASLQNFTRAAKVLGYSQSNVSAQIQQLEQEVGVPLFNRIGKTVSLTQYGEQLVPHAQQVVSLSIKVENCLKSKETLGGTIRVGIVESLFQCFMEPVVLDYHEQFPNVKIELVVDGTAMLLELLQQGQLDFACLIDTLLPQAKWNIWYKAPTPIRIIANPDHPLANRNAISLSDLEHEEFILMEDSASYSSFFESAMAEQQLNLNMFLMLQNAEKACQLVQKNSFLSVLPHYVVSKAVEEQKVSLLAVSDFSHTEYVYLLMHNSKVVTPQIEGFLEIFRREMMQKL